MKDFILKKDRSIMHYAGDMSQFAGAKRYEFLDGKAKGVEAVDIKTGTGFEYTVLPGRGMDIAYCSFKGVPVSYISKTGITSPGYFESAGMGFIRNFFGGLLTTCGLSNVGGPCNDEDPVIGEQHFGLHGRISNAAAEQVCVHEDWNDDGEYIITVSGKVREAQLHGESFILAREIKSVMGENRLVITDRIENRACYDMPMMLLYHINIGYPILDKGSRLVLKHRDMQPNDEYSQQRMDEYRTFGGPVKRERENVYFHDLCKDDNGDTMVGIVNDKLEAGVYVRFNKNQLGEFTQWKMCGESEYVFGIEPGNCVPSNRMVYKENGKLADLGPYEQTTVKVEIGVLQDKQEISDFETRVGQLGLGQNR